MRRGKKPLRNKKSPMYSSSRKRCLSLKMFLREFAEKRASACLPQKPLNACNKLIWEQRKPTRMVETPVFEFASAQGHGSTALNSSADSSPNTYEDPFCQETNSAYERFGRFAALRCLAQSAVGFVL